MPFDPAPAKVGQYQRFADLMLRGCVIRPIQCKERYWEGSLSACALGAIGAAMFEEGSANKVTWGDTTEEMEVAYCLRYGCSIPTDNDDHGLTREQIAARIAAL